MPFPTLWRSDAALVGRQCELATLEQQLAAALAGRTAVVLLAGEPGMGKTRLLTAVAARAAAGGALVRWGGASDAEGMPPYLPFLEALGQHIRAAAPEDLRTQIGPLAGILGTILPELAFRLGDLPPSYSLPPEQARLRLYEAVGSFLAAIASARPLLLLLDDLHWADPASLDLLSYVVRHQPAARLLVLGAYRPGEAEANPAFGRAVGELSRRRILQTVTVGPLAEDEVATLASAALGAPLDQAARTVLFAHSEGNPFFAEELLRAWLEAGALVLVGDAAARRYTLTALDEPALPPTIASTIRARLDRLAPEVVETLRIAAVVGRTFEVSLLAEVVGQEPDAVEAQLRIAARAQLLRPASGGSFSFSHDKIRECLAADLTTFRRQRAHGLIGRTLEARAEPADAYLLADLAFHYGRSGDRGRGAAYAREAAGQALRTFAYEEALAHFRTALGLMEPSEAQWGEVLLELGEAASLAGAEAVATATYRDARRWFERRGDLAAAGRAAYREGRAWWRQEAIGEAREAFESALGLLEQRPGPDLVRLLVDLGSLLAVSLHHHAAGIAYSRRALELADRLGDRRLSATASRSLGNLLVRNNDLSGGIVLLERALEQALAVDDPVEGAECCACLAVAYFSQGEIGRSHDAARRRLGFAERTHDPYELRHVYTWLAVVDGVRGKSREAERWLSQAQAIVERLASPEPLAYVHFCRGMLAFFQGEPALAEAQLREAIAIFRAIGPGALVWYLGALGWVQAAQGKVAEARAGAEEVEALLAAFPEGTTPPLEPLVYLTQAALLLGDGERLARYYPRLLAFEGRFGDLLIDRLLGEIEVGRGDWAGAESHLDAAERVARREPLPWDLAFTLEAQARLALARGGRGRLTRVRGLLEQAAEQYERLGDHSNARRLRERLRSLARGNPRSAPQPAGLTAREVEVLRLVAAGKSNREIATALVVSAKTVENHLGSIYAKIGADNRASATAFAIRHGLA